MKGSADGVDPLRAVPGDGDDPPDLPPSPLLARQSERLAPLRSRVFRRLGIARRGPVLDLGAGHGAVTAELVRRSAGPVIALDRHRRVLAAGRADAFAGAVPVAGDGTRLPFGDGTFALVLAQLVFLWQRDPSPMAQEVARVLAPGGAVLAIEPDFGGLLEWPERLALGPVWEAAIARAGGDPRAGRKLPTAFGAGGLSVTVDLHPAISAPDPDRFDLLEGLPLTGSERARVAEARCADASGDALVHLPFLYVTGVRD